MQVSTQEGQVTAKLVTENESVKAALESQIAQLKESLTNQGFRVEEVEITVASHEFDQTLEENQMHEDARREAEEQANGNGQRGSGRNINFNDDGELPELDEAEALTARMMREQGNTLNFRA